MPYHMDATVEQLPSPASGRGAGGEGDLQPHTALLFHAPFVRVIIFALLLTFTHTGRAADSKTPTAALLDVNRQPVGALVEQSLLPCQRVTWLERTEIDRVLKEQQLTALLSPESCRQRSTIGRLLKADLLVLLRHFDQPKPYVQLVVCESARGLRLAVHQVPLSDDVEADAATLTQLAEQGIARHDRPIEEICAVPPFVSHDLTYENDYRKAAYARLVEQTIADRPGLLTVELEEAQAIADEVGLSGQQVQRNLPLYLLGDYRHEGKGEGQTATLRVLVKRGEQALDKRLVIKTPIDQAASFIRNATAELIDQTSGVLPSRPNPKVEAEQLAQRAETFHQLGGWDEAASLAEASLMLDPGQKRMHEVAASALAYLARRDAEFRNSPDVVARGIHFYFRALEHYEWLLPADSRVDEGDIWRLHTHLSMAVNWANLSNSHNTSAEVRRVAGELRETELEILLRITRARCVARTGDAYRFVAWALFWNRPPQEQFDILLQIVGQIQDLPDARQLVSTLTLHGYTIDHLDNPEGRQYLQRLAANTNPQVRSAAEDLQSRLDQHVPPPDPLTTKRPNGESYTAANMHVRFEPVAVKMPPTQSEFPPSIGGWLPVGEGADLLLVEGIHLMVDPGRFEFLWKGEAVFPFVRGITELSYDGRFAWAATELDKGKPTLLVIDPRAKKTWEIGEADGLPVVAPETIPTPNLYPQIHIAPLGPGRVLFASWFGRLAIGTASFDPDQGTKVDVFFEATHPLDPTTRDRGGDPQMAFPPSYAIACRGKNDQGRSVQSVLLGVDPGSGQYGRHDRPLVIEPGARTVAVLKTPLGNGINRRRDIITPEAAYLTDYRDRMQRCLIRIRPPDFVPEVLIRDIPDGYGVMYDGRLLLFGDKCWLLDPAAEPGRQIQVLTETLPWSPRSLVYRLENAGQTDGVDDAKLRYLEMLRPSSHYGLLAICNRSRHGSKAFRVVFDESQHPRENGDPGAAAPRSAAPTTR